MPICVTCRDERAPVLFAAGELTRYLGKMLPPEAEGHLSLLCEGDGLEDRYDVHVDPAGGRIAGSNPRSVLLGTYALLHALGCRFLGPGQEVVPAVRPEDLRAQVCQSACFRHRGVCIEGADSVENVLDFVDWLPKAGYNAFFLQFKTPYAFLKRWYHHEKNPLRAPEPFDPADAERAMERIEAEVKRRGLLLHKAGHGWTGEVLGYDALDWDAVPRPLREELRGRAALVDGRRELFRGVPANTNLCLSDPDGVDAFAQAVTDYAAAHPAADYLHVWLADEYNNVCQCPECQKTTLSDQYVSLLNKIDRRLTDRGLDTRVVFLLYQELLWPPVAGRLANPERFVLMFAPISRTFERSYDLGGPKAPIPSYVRNRIALPTGLGENLAFLRGWQDVFSGDSFDYDYPLGRAHYGDLGYLHMAQIIHGDVQALEEMGLGGYVSCQELRAGCPNFLPNYVLGRVLFQKDLPLEEIVREYFQAAYGEGWQEAYTYLSRLSQLDVCDYLNGKGPRRSPETADRLSRALEVCRAFTPRGEGHWWEILAFHKGYAERLLTALLALSRGEKEGCREAYRGFRDYVCEAEPRVQTELDVYRVLEVTGKYTGFPDPDQEGENL